MSIEDNLRKYAFLESGGCVIDIILFVVCCFFPVLFIFYIPYSIYSSYKFFKQHSSIGKELRMLEKNKAIMEERLKNMSTEEVKALRNKYVEILNSPQSSDAEKDAAEFMLNNFERLYKGY